VKPTPVPAGAVDPLDFLRATSCTVRAGLFIYIDKEPVVRLPGTAAGAAQTDGAATALDWRRPLGRRDALW